MIPLDKMYGFIWFDGEFISWPECKVHIVTHSLHYGGAVFEGIRIYNKNPFKLQEHNERLIKSADLLGYSIPYSVSELNDAVKSTVKRQNLESGYIRVLAWRGSQEQQISGRTCSIHVAIMAWNTFKTQPSQEKGLKLEISDWRKPPPQSTPFQSKASGLYMMATVVQNKARLKGFDDALLLDMEDNITEATTSNFFMIKNDILYTPIPDCFLNGITRQTVLEIAAELGIESRVEKISIEDLEGVSEAFLTGTAIEIAPISSIYIHKSGTTYEFEAHPITKLITNNYLEKTRQDV